MNKQRKKALWLTAAVVLLLLLVSQIVAFFTSEDMTTNRYSAKKIPDPVVRIAITETFEPPTTPSEGPYKKDVKITNTGTESCYPRVRLEFSDAQIAAISSLSADGTQYVPVADYTTDLPTGWVYREGYYYFTDPLPPGEATNSLFQWVKTVFPADADGSVTPKDFDIFVYAEAVQAVDADDNELDYAAAWRLS